jgi:hypothetical protein
VSDPAMLAAISKALADLALHSEAEAEAEAQP